MPEKLRIDDLRAPVLTDVQRAALAYGEKQRIELRAGAVLAAAVKRTGLEDFGAGDFEERLALQLEEVDQDGERTGLGRLTVWSDAVRAAANRLLIRDLLKRHPDIEDVEIRRPIIVVGLPRSGTTHLVNLIAADQRLRSMPLWEGQEPVRDPHEPPGADGVDPRYARSARAWAAMQQTAPLVAAMHPMSPDHIHEEIELQLPDFASYNQEWVVRAPRWRDHYLAHDQTPHYAYMKTVLQILQWTRPRERWVLKSPQHLEQLGPLLATFPDATLVVTHRDPVSVIQSAITMLTYGARTSYRTPRPEWYLAYWSDRVRRLLEASVRDRKLVPAERSLDVLFHEFMADDLATVERIYAVAGLPLTPEARAQIQAYLREHPRGKEGQVVYDLRRDFDTEPAELRRPFGFYLDRFPVRVEVS
jgi:Sulfotransferase family